MSFQQASGQVCCRAARTVDLEHRYYTPQSEKTSLPELFSWYPFVPGGPAPLEAGFGSCEHIHCLGGPSQSRT